MASLGRWRPAALLLFVCGGCGSLSPEPVPAIQWTIQELEFSAKAEHPNPFLAEEPLLQVELRHASGEAPLLVDGFWDGGQNWKVRLTLPLNGRWDWRSISKDPGMDARRGSFNVYVPITGVAAEPSGPLRVAPGGRYLERDGGPPFLWLADTVWAFNTRRCGLGENRDGAFYTWLSDRKRKGFSSVLVELYHIRQRNEGGFPFPRNTDDNGDYSEINPKFFQALDTRMRAVWEAGIIPALHPTWNGKQEGISLKDYRRVLRYLMARYGAYPAVWSLSGEYQYSYSNKKFPWTHADWNELGEFVQKLNIYRHPLSIHPSGRQDGARPESWPPGSYEGSSGGEFHNADWLDHNWLQTGHATDRLWRIPTRIAEARAKPPAKPVFHSEGYYENHSEEGATPAQIRWQAWVAFLSGSAGHGYGATPLFQFHVPDHEDGAGDDRFNRPHWDGRTSWREALNYEGGGDLTHLASFLREREWWRLEPLDRGVTIEGRSPDMKSLRDPHAARIGAAVVVYVPEGNSGRRIEVECAAAATCAGRWFDPRNGAWAEGAAEAGPFLIPSGDDWVLLVE